MQYLIPSDELTIYDIKALTPIALGLGIRFGIVNLKSTILTLGHFSGEKYY